MAYIKADSSFCCIDVTAVSSSDWKKSFTLTDESQLGAITALGLSVNGVYLATAARAGVAIWSTQTRRVLIQLPAVGTAAVTQIAWSPTQNLIAWADAEGTLVRYHDAVPKTFADPVTAPSGAGVTMNSTKRKETSILDDLLAGEGGLDEEKNGDVALDGDDDGMNDFLDDDLGEFLKDDGGEAQFRSGQVEVGKRCSSLPRTILLKPQLLVNITKAQGSFQPGATPMDASKRKRLLGMFTDGMSRPSSCQLATSVQHDRLHRSHGPRHSSCRGCEDARSVVRCPA
jgi:chromosome transmission fidelity protein 4